MLKTRFYRTGRAALAILCATAGATVSTSVNAACDTQNSFRLDWDSQAAGSISKSTPIVYNVTNGAGASALVTLSFSGDTADIATLNFGGTVGAVETPYIGAINVGGLASSSEKTLTIGAIFDGYQSSIDSNVDVAVVTLAFGVAVRDVQFTVLDIDYFAGQFRDWLKITGTGPGGTFIPAISSPFGNDNAGNPGQTSPGVALIGPYTATAPNTGSSEIIGNGSSDSTQNYGNITARFAQPVTSVQLRYANGPEAYMSGAPGQQAISIHDISFCPMPDLVLQKTAAPLVTAAGDPARFEAPGSDVLYSLTVSNNGGSAVDANTIILDDLLPGQVSFYNGDIDDAGPLTTNYEFDAGSSGLTLGSGNLSFSNNGGGSYAYSPVSGYDAAVNAIRLRPQGSMAPNSSFTIRFRAQVN